MHCLRPMQTMRTAATGPWSCAIAALLAGCATLEEMAPPVAVIAAVLDADDSDARAILDHGRTLFVTDCARCHAVVPVLAHTRAEWREILPRMAKESAMGASELRAIERYVDAALTASGR